MPAVMPEPEPSLMLLLIAPPETSTVDGALIARLAEFAVEMAETRLLETETVEFSTLELLAEEPIDKPALNSARLFTAPTVIRLPVVGPVLVCRLLRPTSAE